MSNQENGQPSSFPYNRIVQWAAGPVSAGVGLIVAWLAVRMNFVLPPGVHDAVIQGAVAAVLGGIGMIVTYLAHHKWFSNLADWYFTQQDAGGGTVVNNAVPLPVDDEPADVAGADDAPTASV